MASIDFNLSPELAYCLKDNVAYPAGPEVKGPTTRARLALAT